MSLVSGPGRAGATTDPLPGDLHLAVDKHVKYIQALDTVRAISLTLLQARLRTDSVGMSWSTG